MAEMVWARMETAALLRWIMARVTDDDGFADREKRDIHPMRHLAILDCPVVFSGENTYAMTSIDMCPSVGVTRGLVSRHVKIIDARVIAVCIWEDQMSCMLFFNSDWYERAAALWGDSYQLRLEAIDASQAA